MASITPFISQNDAPGELQDAVVELFLLDAALNANIPEALRGPMTYLLRYVNSFYSNKIEGNSTHPAEILNAQEEGPEKDPTDDLLEIKQHVEVLTLLSNLDVRREDVCTPDFLKNIHKSFYERLPEKILNKKILKPGKI